MPSSTVPLRQCQSQSECLHPEKTGDGWLPETTEYFYRSHVTFGRDCKFCARKKARDYNAANRERISIRNKKKYDSDPEKYRSQRKRYRRENPEKVRESKNRYNRENPDKRRAIKQRYQRNNPEKTKEIDKIKNQRRRARKRGLPNTLTKSEWQYALDYFKNRCAVCGAPFGGTFSRYTASADHWIPLSSTMGDNPGTVVENIVPLCHGEDGCNNSKHNYDPHEWLIE